MILERSRNSQQFRRAARRILRELVICVLLPSALLVSAELVAQKTVESDAQQQTDNQTASDINGMLQTSSGLSSLDLGVSVHDGAATLTGTVPTAALRRQADDLARGVTGVTSVDDRITVGAQSAAADQTNGPQQSPGMAPPPPSQDYGQQPQERSGQENYGPNGPPPPQPSEQENQNYDQNGPPPASQSGPGSQSYDQNGPHPPPPAQQEYQNPGPDVRVTVAPQTPVTIMMLDGVNSKHTKPGTPFRGVLVQDVILQNGIIAIPRGAYVHGIVIDSRGPGHLKGHPRLALQLSGLEMLGAHYPLTSYTWDRRGPGKGAQTTNNVVGGAVVGTAIGGFNGGGAGALLGAAIGGLGGAGLSSLSSGPRLVVPAESVLTFYLNEPVTVREPNVNEIRSLAGNVPASRYGNGYGPHPYPPPGGYPPPGYGPPPGYPPPGGPPGGYPY